MLPSEYVVVRMWSQGFSLEENIFLSVNKKVCILVRDVAVGGRGTYHVLLICRWVRDFVILVHILSYGGVENSERKCIDGNIIVVFSACQINFGLSFVLGVTVANFQCEL
jgi:hypothetical protein